MKPNPTFRAGDRVWFISKFGDLVTGVYEGADTLPGADGPVDGHLVRSDDAFGPASQTKGVLCFVQSGLHHNQ